MYSCILICTRTVRDYLFLPLGERVSPIKEGSLIADLPSGICGYAHVFRVWVQQRH